MGESYTDRLIYIYDWEAGVTRLTYDIDEAGRLTIADIVPAVEATLDSSCVASPED